MASYLMVCLKKCFIPNILYSFLPLSPKFSVHRKQPCLASRKGHVHQLAFQFGRNIQCLARPEPEEEHGGGQLRLGQRKLHHHPQRPQFSEQPHHSLHTDETAIKNVIQIPAKVQSALPVFLCSPSQHF